LTDVDVFAIIDRSTKVNIAEDDMGRVQLALNVTDLEAAVGFYSKLFDTAPAKRRPGYANFAIEDPPLKLILVEGHGAGGTLNHLGVEVPDSDDVAAAQARLAGQGLLTAVEDQVDCCYARQDKVWVDGPDGEPWEIYTVLADVEMPLAELRGVEPADPSCCDAAPESAARCC
jgi:catechol 2,3-dioxygenase-like lactoylglutathione lyase family enzyme